MPLKYQATWQAGAPFQGQGQTSSWTPASTPTSELSRAGMWGRDLASFLLLGCLHCSRSLPPERALAFITGPWELTAIRSVEGVKPVHAPTSCQFTAVGEATGSLISMPICREGN